MVKAALGSVGSYDMNIAIRRTAILFQSEPIILGGKDCKETDFGSGTRAKMLNHLTLFQNSVWSDLDGSTLMQRTTYSGIPVNRHISSNTDASLSTVGGCC